MAPKEPKEFYTIHVSTEHGVMGSGFIKFIEDTFNAEFEYY